MVWYTVLIEPGPVLGENFLDAKKHISKEDYSRRS